MITLLNKKVLYNTFDVNDFTSLEEAIESMAPSLVEYELSALCQYNDEVYFNRKEIQQTIYLGEYSLYKDYDSNIYLEINTKEDEETTSLW